MLSNLRRGMYKASGADLQLALSTATHGLQLMREDLGQLPCEQVLLARVENTLHTLDAAEVARTLGSFLWLSAEEIGKLTDGLTRARADYPRLRAAQPGRDISDDVETIVRDHFAKNASWGVSLELSRCINATGLSRA